MVPRPYLTRLAAAILVLAAFSLASAQSDDQPTIGIINVGSTIDDTITAESIFDIWEFDALAGEEFRAEMQASGGLIPLLGLRNPSGDIIVASNILEDGTSLDAEPDGSALIVFQIPSDGLYALIASRAGTSDGTSTGSYTLLMESVGVPSEPLNEYLDVTFRCGANTVTSALGVLFGDQGETSDAYVVTLYGFDGFDPVLRFGGDDGTLGAPCELSSMPETLPALQFSFAGESLVFDKENVTGVAVYTVTDSDTDVFMTVGSRNGAAGRYALHIAGLSVETPEDTDRVNVRVGARAKDEPVILWMLRDGLSRLDPFIAAPEGAAFCADVGLRTCVVPELSGARVEIRREGEPSAASDRLDAAALLATGTTEIAGLVLASQNPRTTGQYALWFFGTLPPAQTAP